MLARIVALGVVGFPLAASATPLPAALDKFHKEGIRPFPERPSLIRGEVRTRGGRQDHLFRLGKGQRYQFQVSAEYPANVQVVDVDSGSVVFNSAAAKGDFVAPKDGQYRVRVASPSGGVGRYALTVLQKRPPVRRDPPGVHTVTPAGLTINDNIVLGDQPDRVRRHLCKTYDVRLDAGKAYQIDMTARFDTYLRVEDAAGKQIAFNDDGGAGLNSRLVLNAPGEGIYRIICTSFGGAQGPFTLMVRAK